MCCRLFNNQSRDRYVYKMKKNIWQKIIIISVIFIMVLLDLFALNFSSIFLILIGAVLGIILSMIKERKTL